jgi:hypothetical protein
MDIKELKHCKKIMQIDNNEANILYYLVRNSSRVCEPHPQYGIEIEKEQGSLVVDKFSALECFYSEDEAEALLKVLAYYKVTPISASEVIEELLNDL